MFEALGTKGLEDTDGGMKMGPKEWPTKQEVNWLVLYHLLNGI